MTRQRTTRRYNKQGQFSEARSAWTRIDTTDVVIYEHDGEGLTYQDGSTLHEVVLSIRTGGRQKPMSVNLSGMTREELEVLREIFDYAITKARPTCDALDAIAQEAFDAYGDDTYVRLYRPVPQLFVRQRPQSQHDPRLSRRSERAGDVDDEPGTGQSGDDDGELPERPSDDMVTEDYGWPGSSPRPFVERCRARNALCPPLRLAFYPHHAGRTRWRSRPPIASHFRHRARANLNICDRTRQESRR